VKDEADLKVSKMNVEADQGIKWIKKIWEWILSF
jgi:hypothetical protein